MKFGERCALEGVLGFLKPRLSVEIGTAQGGSLHRVALHSQEVHSFDIVPAVADLEPQFPNVEFHIGDSASLLPEFLAGLADRGRNVDFVLVDGDHTAEGVARDARALLDAEACRQTVIVFHDAANEEVRAGIESVGFGDHPKVALSLLDFVPGYVVADGPRRFEIWNGLALVILDDAPRTNGAFIDSEVYNAAALNRRVRDALRDEEGRDPLDRAPGRARETTDAADPFDPSGSIGGVPERFVPDQMSGGLVAAEHISRYWWAARLAEGRRVLDAGCGVGYGSNMLADAGASEVVGVDIATSIVEAASVGARPNVTFETGDVASLGFDDESFEVVVCFEVIEHVEDTDAVLDELARVLAPDGVLLISSPNRDAYVQGNPHHRYEFLPDELWSALGSRFAHVRLLRQHDWLASAILDDAAFEASGDAPLDGLEVRKLTAQEPGKETYTLALASDRALVDTPVPLTLTGSIELRRWIDNYQAQDRILREQAQELIKLQTLDRERRELRWRLEQAEADVARIPGLELAVAAEQRRGEQTAQQLELRLRGTDQALRDVMSSPSWRITAPLRWTKELVKRMLSG